MGCMSVTQIIWDLYPFTQQDAWISSLNDELKELWKEPVEYEDIMQLTQTVGDMIHTFFIETAMGFPSVWLPSLFKAQENSIKEFVSQNKIRGLICEFHIEKPGEYIGHPDLIVMMEYQGKIIKALVDIKTYGLYRMILWLPERQKNKLNGNTSKVSLQTSMYRDALVFSQYDHIYQHWNVSHLFCFHVKYDSVDMVELKYDIGKYLGWRDNLNK